MFSLVWVNSDFIAFQIWSFVCDNKVGCRKQLFIPVTNLAY